MTREEAILVLHDMKDTYDEIHENTNFEIGYEQMTALDMAIEALANLKEEFESAANCKRCAIKQLWEETEKEDLVSVVRCKDCRHWLQHEQFGFDEDNDEYHDYCALLVPDDDYYAYTRKADDFCSWGERREE